MKVLVTGINGFVGKHLTRALTAGGVEVSGAGREDKIDPEIKPFVKNFYVCDLVDKEQVSKIDFSPFDVIIHLAGLANVGESYKNPALYMEVNVKPLINICDSLIKQKVTPRIIAISTGGVYESNQNMPLSEKSSLVKDGSPYVKSKIAMEEAALEYATKGLNCVIIRPFNHIGPGQGEGFLVPDLTRKLQEAMKSEGTLKTGDLSTRRDYTDVRDVAEAYKLLAMADKDSLSSRIYNVCSGATHSGEEILNELKKNIPGSEKVKAEVDPSLIRPKDPKELKGSNQLINKDVGWLPKIPFEQTIRDSIT